MIGILKRGLLSPGLKFSIYQKQGTNLRNYLPWSSTSLINRPKLHETSNREMCRVIKAPSQRAIKLQTSDGIPLNYNIIYNSFEYHTISQYLSTGLSALYVLAGTAHMIINYDEVFPDFHTGALNLWISILFLYVNIGTAIISYKSPVRIYHDKETGDYKAIFNAFRPFNIRVIEFKKGMVEKIKPTDVITLFKSYRYKIKGQDLYMFDMYFRYPGDLYSMFDEMEIEE